MRKKSLHFLLILASLLSVGVLLVFSAGQVYFTGSFGDAHIAGVFSTGGNAGIISFDDIPSGFSGVQIVGSQGSIYLTGIFWLQTVGWATFSDAGIGKVELIPPTQSIRDPWYLSGYAWSENAGWISLNREESSSSGIWYLPDTATFTGFAWNDALGWIPFDPNRSGIPGFIGKLTIGGSIGGNKSFRTLYTPGMTYGINIGSSLGEFLNIIRKNTTIISRNAESNNKINTNLNISSPESLNHTIFYRKNFNPSQEFLTYSVIETAFNNYTDKIKTVVVVGADIYINTGVLSSFDFPRTFITLKNEFGHGGNVYISGNVKKIDASIIAEGTIWSGDNPGGSIGLSPYFINKPSIFYNIPSTQLYIHGLIASRNTIGGSSQVGGAICPAFTRNNEPCTYDSAIPYDWNYFRNYDTTPENRAYKDSSKDEYSVIMEPDSRLILNPPPGLENTR